MTRQAAVFVLMGAALVVGHTVAFAAEDPMTGRVLVRVVGESTALAGTVVLTDGADVARRRQIALGQARAAWFVEFEPGTYTVAAATAMPLDVSLTIGAREVVTIDLAASNARLRVTRLTRAREGEGADFDEAYALGRTRYTYAGTIDARVEQGFAFGRARVAIRFDVFNLSNHKNEVEEDVLTGPAFRRSTAVQPPITARAGLLVEF